MVLRFLVPQGPHGPPGHQESNESIFCVDAPNGSERNFIIGICFLVVNTSVVIILIPLLYLRSSRFAVIRKRDHHLLGITLFGCLLQLLWAVDDVQYQHGFPCQVQIAIPLCVLTFQIFPTFLRLRRFVKKKEYYKKIADFSLASAMKKSQQLKAAAAAAFAHGSSSKLEINNITSRMELQQHLRSDSSPSINLYSDNGSYQPKKLRSEFLFFNRGRGKIQECFFMLVAVLLTIVVALPLSTKREVQCLSPCPEKSILHSLSVLAAFTGFFALCAMNYIRKVRNEPDPLHILQELKFLTINGLLTALIVFPLRLIDPGKIDSGGEFSFVNIWLLGNLNMELLILGLPLYYSYKLEFSMRTKTTNELTLKAIMSHKSETMRNAFETFLLKTYCIENYLFLKDAKAYKSGFHQRTIEENVEWRKEIYHVYIRDNDPENLQINLRSDEYTVLTCNLLDETDPKDTDMDVGINAIEFLLGGSPLHDFKQSPEYQRILHEAEPGDHELEPSSFEQRISL